MKVKKKYCEKNDLRFNKIKNSKSKNDLKSPLGTINIELMSNLSYFSKVEI